jgi:lysophospholipase L1-like esterase
VFFNSTIRQTIQVSIPGKRIRLRLSNAFGATDLPISAVTIALPVDGAAGTSKIQTRTLKSINFSGKSSIIIPNGALAVSDPIDFEVKARTTVAITMYLESGQQGNDITSHPGSRTTSFFSHGNHVSDADLTDPSTSSAAHWYFISALEVLAPTSTSAFVVVGDSITDGRGSETNNNNRWADLLSIRLLNNPRTSNIAIANEAAGGNRVLHDGLGPNALGRIDRDVLAQSGVKYALIYEGINDIGTGNTTTSAAEQQDTSDRLIWAYQQIAERIQTAGIKAFIVTITPFMYPADQFQPTWDAERERTRQRVNKWIRENDVFDGVVDFDAVLRDPAQKNIMQARYSSGDYLHPNVLGYQTLANAFPLDLFS